jgi:glycosyltransferase involved in cell wall biosynthesis
MKRSLQLTEDTGLFLGGLDESKRLDFLLTACEAVYRQRPSFRLLVAGDGTKRSLVEDYARTHPWVIPTGSVSGRYKAALLAASKFIAMPGRVGLVAVDSFAARVPIVTTNWNLHAPEFEYLSHLTNSVITSDRVAAYSQAVLELLRDTALQSRLRAGCEASAATFSVESMASRFVSGLAEALNTR